MKTQRYFFEVSWEVCNMVGGIHTVLASKTYEMLQRYGKNYIAVGPHLPNSGNMRGVFREEIWQPEFIETLSAAGIGCRMGRWLIPGEPRCLLVDFNHWHDRRDKILFDYWQSFGLNSLYGGWDYCEPMYFGHAVGVLIEHLYKKHIKPTGESVVVQCHEWMSAAPILYLRSTAPEIGTVFTTHATMLGRALSGNQRHLDFSKPKTATELEHLAHEIGVSAKHSMETVSARLADCFTTVSESAAEECHAFLGRKPDVILLNALGEEFPDAHLAEATAAKKARERLLDLAELTTAQRYERQKTRIIISSGRYEFRNKGIDVLIDSLGALNRQLKGKSENKLIAFLMFPAGHTGPRQALLKAIQEQQEQHSVFMTTHELRDEDHDPIISAFKNAQLSNRPEDVVHVVFIPIYLDGTDPLVKEKYYELLPGADLSVFPSFYEPWGYTPMESIACGVPTITSDLAGFGLWAQKLGSTEDTGIYVLPRKGLNPADSSRILFDLLSGFVNSPQSALQKSRKAAFGTALQGRWKQHAKAYFEAHSMALEKAKPRAGNVQENLPDKNKDSARAEGYFDSATHMKKFLVLNRTPAKLEKLRKLAKNIWWSWNPEAVSLFSKLDPDLWTKCGQNPSIFLDYVQPEVLDNAADSEKYLKKLDKVYSDFEKEIDAKASPAIAFFCVEYGLIQCLKLYSGGLGILAGDILKTASDMKLPFCAVGLAWHYGYFHQSITKEGNQEHLHDKADFFNLPIELIRNSEDQPLIVSVPFPSHPVHVRAWKVRVGTVDLFLLDTDFGANRPEDRAITNNLYGGDLTQRLRQEFILGIGGLKILQTLGISPQIFHMNEGHSAFLVLARLVDLMTQENLHFDEALEYIRHTSLFTTHTPVPAGHDHFPEEIIRPYLSPFGEAVKKDWPALFDLGRKPSSGERDFNMTYLSLRGSMRANGVSKIHGKISRKMFTHLYPGFHEFEVPIKSVTNGVHVPTWIAPEWRPVFSKHLDKNWLEHLADAEYWQQLKEVDSKLIWETHLQVKDKLIQWLKGHIELTYIQRREHPSHMGQALAFLQEDPLLIGFARRFAPYKRSNLLFHNPKKLEELLTKGRPIVFLYAGKAHPSDGIGQGLIKRLIEFSRQQQFAGKIIFLENYEMDIAQLLVSGCDMWLNTPTRPLEASGTSGIKAAINGCLNLSVADGWWAEGYNGKNGWIIADEHQDNPIDFQNEYDSARIYALLEHEILPMFEDRNSDGVPEAWVQRIKESIASIIPGFSSERMMREYKEHFYDQAIDTAHALSADRFSGTIKLCQSKRHLSHHWNNVKCTNIHMTGLEGDNILIDQPINIKVELSHPDLSAADLTVQTVIRRMKPYVKTSDEFETHKMKSVESNSHSSVWETEIICAESGPYAVGVRIVPRSYENYDEPELLHGLVKWL